jgi:hypothetical protein
MTEGRKRKEVPRKKKGKKHGRRGDQGPWGYSY